MPKQNKYVATVVNVETDQRFEVEVIGFNPQGAHRNLMYNGGCDFDDRVNEPNAHYSVPKSDRFKFRKEEIIKMKNKRGFEVFHVKYGFTGIN